jgi:hypothetical protein
MAIVAGLCNRLYPPAIRHGRSGTLDKLGVVVCIRHARGGPIVAKKAAKGAKKKAAKKRAGDGWSSRRGSRKAVKRSPATGRFGSGGGSAPSAGYLAGDDIPPEDE